MSKKLVLASAGAGKSQMIVNTALSQAHNSIRKVLILTYTENNQKEIINKICKEKKYLPSNIHVKGWFSFLLEDLIRPYQGFIFKERISGVFFNQSDPHKRNGRSISGRAEIVNNNYNKLHYLTKNKDRVHTAYISKLAARIIKESKEKAISRVSQIYNSILIDEVQDLVGWDFDLIDKISKKDTIAITCVGDFRQTIYTTHVGAKRPKSNTEKIDKFKSLGFEIENLNISWRCIEPICNFADRVHASENIYQKTQSKVLEVPGNYQNHLGVYTVSQKYAEEYLETFDPVILRVTKSTQKQLCKGRSTINFGASKGLGFPRILIIPTNKQKKFLEGNHKVFDNDKTEKAKSSLYVAITRGQFSVAFLHDGLNIENVQKWTPN